MELTGKRIALGITGGIAAYKSAELVRLLVKQGASVQVAMTEAATHFVTPTTFQALSGNRVFTDQPRRANAKRLDRASAEAVKLRKGWLGG